MGEYEILSFKLDVAPGGNAYHQPPTYRRRACDRCVARKIGCDGKLPCSRCQRANHQTQCHYSTISRQPPKRRSKPSQTRGPQHPPPLLHGPELALPTLPDSGRPGAEGGGGDDDDVGQDPKIPAWDDNNSLGWFSYNPYDMTIDIPAFFAGPHGSQFLQRFYQLGGLLTQRTLQSREEAIYHPRLVHSLVAIYVGQQVRVFQRLYLERIYRKIRRGEVSAAVLNYLLAYGSAVVQSTPSARRAISAIYFEQLRSTIPGEMARPTLETPYLIYLIGSLHATINESEGFGYYIVDLPNTETGAAIVHSSVSFDLYVELTKEYKRRSIWELATFDNLIFCMLGSRSFFTATRMKARPINDRLIHQLFQLNPDQDNFPILIPGIRHTLCGYPTLIDLALIVGKVADLRASVAEAVEATGEPDLTLYYQLNNELDQLQVRLLAEYPLPEDEPSGELVERNAAYFSSLYTLHSTFFSTQMILNVYNWNISAPARPASQSETRQTVITPFRPEQHPAFRYRGLQAARFFDRQLYPIIRKLPFQFHTNVFSGAAFLSALTFALILPSDPTVNMRHVNQCVRDYLDYLAELTKYISYVQSYIVLLGHLLTTLNLPPVNDTTLQVYPRSHFS
ncbi:hypothetical protein H4R33_000378 [Dimargaris cristalligena]|nr:hypothetical protein H4R33_000378 [Dimargaris cristalligena]